MIKIVLENAKFYAYHGIHEEERLVGGEYLVTIEAGIEERVNIITRIEDTINYSDLYEIADIQMSIALPLIETVAMRIGQAVLNKYKNLKNISVTLKKLNPPIMRLQGDVSVSWKKEY